MLALRHEASLICLFADSQTRQWSNALVGPMQLFSRFWRQRLRKVVSQDQPRLHRRQRIASNLILIWAVHRRSINGLKFESCRGKLLICMGGVLFEEAAAGREADQAWRPAGKDLAHQSGAEWPKRLCSQDGGISSRISLEQTQTVSHSTVSAARDCFAELVKQQARSELSGQVASQKPRAVFVSHIHDEALSYLSGSFLCMLAGWGKRMPRGWLASSASTLDLMQMGGSAEAAFACSWLASLCPWLRKNE